MSGAPGADIQHPLLNVPIAEQDGRVLDWRPQYDVRSRAYAAAPEDAEPPTDGILWRPGRVLDQGREGACCGFAAAAELAATPQRVPRVTNGYALGVYREAQRIDQWPGENYSGTSVLATMKALRNRGLYGGFLWSFTVAQFAVGLRKGPGVIGVEWRAGNYSTDRDAVIRPGGNVVGGHALCVLGFVSSGAELDADAWQLLEQLGLVAGIRRVLADPTERGVFVAQNSWGEDYGAGGLFLVPWSVMEAWCAAGWEAAHPTGRRRERPVAGSQDVQQDRDDAPDPEPATVPEPNGDDVATHTLEIPARELQPGDRVFVSDAVTLALGQESVTVESTTITRVGTGQQVRVRARAGSFPVGADVVVKVRRPV